MTTHAVAASSDAAGIQPDEGGSQPTLLLHLLDGPDFSARRYNIRPVTHLTAERWMERYHYLGDVPPASDYIGVFAPDLMAVVSVGLPNNAYGIAAKYGLTDYPGNVEINRVAVHPASPTTTSRLMWLVVRSLCADRGWSWTFSYADTGRGHHGGIYQALGAVYVGLSEALSGWEHEDGTRLHPRTAVSLFGSQAAASMAQRGYHKVPDAITAKHVYILPVGPLASAIRERLRPVTLPYPKRASDAA